MLTVIYHIGEMGDPVAKDDHAGFLCKLQVYFDVAMAVNKIIHIGVILDIPLCKEHKMLAILSHIGRFFTVWALHAAMLGPVQAKPHTPAWMYVGESPLAEFGMEYGTYHLELFVRVAESITMCQIEHLSI